MSDKLSRTNRPNWVSSKICMSMQGHWNLVLGAWSNGKSYAVKNGLVEKCYKEGVKLAYIRRYDLDDKDQKNENYFLDVEVERITGGKYNGIVCYRKELFFANYDEKSGKWVKGLNFGRSFSVSAYTHTKSGVYQGFKYGIYEEFVTDGEYLNNEPYKLFRLISSIARNNDIKMYLIGNTITPLCPYYNEWSLANISKQKQGTIDTYTKIEDDGSETVIQVYMTNPTDKKSNMFFGHNKEIHGGTFHADTHDTLIGDASKFEVIYSMVLCYMGKKMLMQFGELDGAHFWYVTPKTSDILKGTRTIGDLRIQSDLHTKSFTPIAPGEVVLFDYLKAGKIRYLDNLTGTIFLQMKKAVENAAFRFS